MFLLEEPGRRPSVMGQLILWPVIFLIAAIIVGEGAWWISPRLSVAVLVFGFFGCILGILASRVIQS